MSGTGRGSRLDYVSLCSPLAVDDGLVWGQTPATRRPWVIQIRGPTLVLSMVNELMICLASVFIVLVDGEHELRSWVQFMGESLAQQGPGKPRKQDMAPMTCEYMAEGICRHP